MTVLISKISCSPIVSYLFTTPFQIWNDARMVKINTYICFSWVSNCYFFHICFLSLDPISKFILLLLNYLRMNCGYHNISPLSISLACISWKGFPGGTSGKESACQCRRWKVWSLGWEDPLKKEMATCSSILAWKIPWTEKPGRLQSMGSQKVGHDWACTHTHLKTRTFSYMTGIQLYYIQEIHLIYSPYSDFTNDPNNIIYIYIFFFPIQDSIRINMLNL